MVATLGLALVAASPALSVIVPFGSDSEQFSEFWLLGPDHMAEGYPFNVGEGEEYSVFVGVANHMGGSEYYRVCVKFSNGIGSIPVGGVPSSLSPLYEYRFFVGDGEVWESLMTFRFEELSVEANVLVVANVTINGVSFPIDASAVWDSESEGYFFELFFELWRYDVELHSFGFDSRAVGLRLNMSKTL
jgi:hypothetical protein